VDGADSAEGEEELAAGGITGDVWAAAAGDDDDGDDDCDCD